MDLQRIPIELAKLFQLLSIKSITSHGPRYLVNIAKVGLLGYKTMPNNHFFRASCKSSVDDSGNMDNPKSRISTTTSVTEAPDVLPAYAQPIPKKDRASSKAARTTPENGEDSSLAKKFANEDKWRHSDVTAFSDDAVFVENNAYSNFPIAPR